MKAKYLLVVAIIGLVSVGAAAQSTPSSDSPAYQQYQELLKANDPMVTTRLWACFYDGKERNHSFFVINAHLFSKSYMMAIVNNFTDGVSASSPSIFEGKIQTYSSKQGIYADLPTSYKDRETDIFKWISGDIEIEQGFGKLMPGQVRTGYRFKLQHSTGRFIEDSVFNTGSEPDGFTNHETGKCIRVPNSVTPEDQYELVEN